MKKETTGKIAKERKNGEKIGLFQSMKFRILLCVLLSAIIVGGVMMFIVLPASTEQITSITQNYIYDLTCSVGQELDIVLSGAGVDKTKEELPELAGDISIAGVDSSYCYVVDSEGTMLYHPQTDKIGQPVENAVVKGVVEKVAAGTKVEPEVVKYEYKGVMKYSAYYVDNTSQFIVVVTADESDILSPVNYMVNKTVMGAVVALVICLVVAAVIIFLMLRPLQEINQEVGRIAVMDFTESEEQVRLYKRKDEIGSMGRALNGLRKELVLVVQDLQSQSENLYQTSERLQNEAVETSDVIDQVDSAVHDIADGATSQADETQSATENVLVIGDMIQQSNGNIQNIKGNSEQIHDSAMVAADTLGQLTQINARVKKAIDEIYQQTHTTNESAIKIKEAAALITSIAEETNLLSLNASIEAARAGEHGKGFAVVANQIQKLAEQSNESANRIEGIISELIEDSERSVSTMEEVREVVEQQDLSVKKTSEIFKTVQNGIDVSLEEIEKISEDTTKMDEARVGVTDTVQNLTAIAEENAASTQETSASVTQVRTSVDTISQSAHGLNDIAMGLEKTMKKFKI